MQTCYRHPSRETALSCSRCGRPICTDCMTAASVGFQCPECVKEGRASQRRATTIVGAPAGAGRTPVVTYTIIAISVIFQVLQQASPRLTAELAMVGSRAPFDGGVADGQVYRLVTAAVLHEGVLHLAFNMLALYFVGSALEPQLGRVRFVSLYLLAAIGGSTASMLAHPYTYSVGASGAVFGLFGAYFVLARRLNRDTGQIAGLIAVNAVLGFVIPRVDWQAHLGGLIVGALFTLALLSAPRRQRSLVQSAAGAVLLCTSLALVAVRSLSL